MTGVMLNYNCKTMAMAKRTNRLSCELVRSLAHTAAPLKPFEAMPCATVWDKLRFISPRNETRRHKLMEELHRKHGKMFRLHFPGLKHKPICCCLLFVVCLFVVCCLFFPCCLFELHTKHGKMFKLHFLGLKHTQVWTCDPQHIKEVLAQVIARFFKL